MKKMIKLLAVSFMLPLLLGTVIINPGSAAEPGKDVISSVQERVDNGFVTGIVIGIIDTKGVQYYKYGKLSHKSNTDVDENTIYEIGSISKVFTSLIMAEMIEQGKLKLDEPIEKYLPKTVKVPSYNNHKITFWHLSTHTSGLPTLPENMIFTEKNMNNPYSDYSTKQLYDFLSTYKLTRDVGSAYEYSNLGAGLLGHILGLIENSSYEELLKKYIVKELNMPSTGITITAEMKKRFAIGHSSGDEVSYWDLPTLAGAGGIRSTASDMLKFIGAEMGLNKTKLANAIKKTQFIPKAPTDIQTTKVSLGWHHTEGPGGQITWHNGGTGGFRSFTGFNPATMTGVIVLANSTDGVDDIGLHILESNYKLAAVPKVLKLSPDILDKYVGNYELQPGYIFTVKNEKNKLMVQLTGQESYPVFATSETKFFYTVVDARLEFVNDNKGKVKSLILDQNGVKKEAKKIE
jgi:D-alanyl-D-alanine-carboxypeptidase/D-alanyl-D-alanine-endopeptidase